MGGNCFSAVTWCQQIKYNPSSCFDNITELNRPEAMKNWLGSTGNRSNGQKASNNSSTLLMKLNAMSIVTPPQSRKDWIDFFAVLCFWLFVMQHNTNYVWKTQWCTLPCRENTNLRLKKDSLCYLKINTKTDNGHNHFKSRAILVKWVICVVPGHWKIKILNLKKKK